MKGLIILLLLLSLLVWLARVGGHWWCKRWVSSQLISCPSQTMFRGEQYWTLLSRQTLYCLQSERVMTSEPLWYSIIFLCGATDTDSRILIRIPSTIKIKTNWTMHCTSWTNKNQIISSVKRSIVTFRRLSCSHNVVISRTLLALLRRIFF